MSKVENYSWGEYDFSSRNIKVLDTSNRDGEQSTRIRHPNLEEKLRLMQLLLEVGIDSIDVGIPIAGGTHLQNAIELAKAAPKHIEILCLARTDPKLNDLRAVLELRDKSQRDDLEVITFIGASNIRMYVQDWELSQMTEWMTITVREAVKQGVKVNVATEHTTQAHPATIKQLYQAGLDQGGRSITIADTSGEANPFAVRRLLHFFKEDVLKDYKIDDIDWHGHNDRDMATACAMEAIDAGATRVHITPIGVGERAGNTKLAILLLNLKKAGDPKRQNLIKLPEVESYAAKIYGLPVPLDYPGVGEKVGSTASGIHASAMKRSREKGLPPDAPYTSIPQSWVGREPYVSIGPMSGASNVEYVASRLGIPPSQPLIEQCLYVARTTKHELTDKDVLMIYEEIAARDKRYGFS